MLAALLDEMSEWNIVSCEMIADPRELLAHAEQRLRALK